MNDWILIVLLIYFVIGVGNFASHVLTCKQCGSHMHFVTEFFFHGLAHICAWPKNLWGYLARHYADEHDLDRAVIVKRQPNEGMGHFITRANKLVEDEKAKGVHNGQH